MIDAAPKGTGNITYSGPMINTMPEMHTAVVECVNSGSETLPEEIADLFTLKVLVAYNEDGSNRGILAFA